MLVMEKEELRRSLTDLKLHVDANNARQAMDIIYNLEYRMVDQDDLDYAYKYGFLSGVK